MTDDALTAALQLARDRRRLPPPPERRALRELAGLSQGAVGRAVGTSAAAICRYESGARTPTGTRLQSYLSVLDRLARAAR